MKERRYREFHGMIVECAGGRAPARQAPVSRGGPGRTRHGSSSCQSFPPSTSVSAQVGSRRMMPMVSGRIGAGGSTSPGGASGPGDRPHRLGNPKQNRPYPSRQARDRARFQEKCTKDLARRCIRCITCRKRGSEPESCRPETVTAGRPDRSQRQHRLQPMRPIRDRPENGGTPTTLPFPCTSPCCRSNPSATRCFLPFFATAPSRRCGLAES